MPPGLKSSQSRAGWPPTAHAAVPAGFPARLFGPVSSRSFPQPLVGSLLSVFPTRRTTFFLKWVGVCLIVLAQGQRTLRIIAVRHVRIWIADAGQISSARLGQKRLQNGIVPIELFALG